MQDMNSWSPEEGLWFPEEEYRTMLAAVCFEVEKQIVASEKVVRLRCWLYYDMMRSVEYNEKIRPITMRWIKLRDVIKKAIEEGEIRRYRKSWLTSNKFDRDEVARVYRKKKAISDKWGSVAEHTGYWFEGIVRDAFEEEGWGVGDKKQVFRWKRRKIEIDVYCSSPLHLGVEVKNESSDVFHAPTAISPEHRNEDHEKILEKFEFCKQNGITPVLLASFVDKSFGGFVSNYKGLYIQTLFQFFPVEQEDLVNAIKEKDFRKGFGFGNVRTVASIPDHVRQHIRAIPTRIARLYGFST